MFTKLFVNRRKVEFKHSAEETKLITIIVLIIAANRIDLVGCKLWEKYKKINVERVTSGFEAGQ